MNKDGLILLLGDLRLRQLLKSYGFTDAVSTDAGKSREDAIQERLESQVKQLRANCFIVPVAGIQGSGKSTLLNALAFDEPVLPIDADETTCVPVEIGWSSSPRPEATVHYADGRVTKLPCTEDALRSVVHNESNPGNKLGVTRVVLESSCELFQDGLVLVDLPGTGSLTAANMETTQRYLRESVGVIFMLRTVPPLTRSEAVFVQMQWASLRSAIFVQNRWNDETDAEAEAGRDHNATTLCRIAEQARIPLFEKKPVIHVVNSYQGLNSALTRNDAFANDSGLNSLRVSLAQFGQGWSETISAGILNSLNTDFEYLSGVIARRLETYNLDRGQHSSRMVEDERRFADHLRDVDERAEKMRDDAEEYRRQVRKRLRIWIDDKRGEMRNLMRSKMRAGVVDGPRLDRALRDEQTVASEDIFAQVQEDALTLQDQLRAALEGLEVWNATAPDARFTVGKDGSAKWENMADRIGGVGGVLGAVAAGASYGLIAGPYGFLIGAGLGLLGGLAGAFIGNKTRQGAGYLRIKAVEEEVFAAIDNFLRGTADALNEIADQFCQVLDRQLQQWHCTKTAQFEDDRRISREQLNQTSEQKVRAVQALKNDRQSLDELLFTLKEVCK